MGNAIGSYRLESLTKVFPGVVAVDGANFEVQQSEIHGIIGKNGAGKSVLVNMIAGILRPTSGEIWIGEHKVSNDHYSPHQAHAWGVSLIPQEPMRTRVLSVVDTLFMGRTVRGSFGMLDHAQMRGQTEEIAAKLGVNASAGQKMSDLPIEDQQLLAFGKALFIEKSHIVLLDEITASLSRDRKSLLLQFLKQALKDSPHVSFTLISHHINEILEFCDRVTVMRDGKAVRTLIVPETTKEELAAWVVGEEKLYYAHRSQPHTPASSPSHLPATGNAGQKTPVLQVRDLQIANAFEGVNLDLAIGEVVGLAGLDGSGKDELLSALAGLLRTDKGTILMQGKPVTLSSPEIALRCGIAYLPKKREEQAIVHTRSVEENILLPIYGTFRSRMGLIDFARAHEVARQGVQMLNVKTPSLNTDIDHLSGGNRQKVVINRIVNTAPQVYLLHEPTRGVDLATKPEILRAIRERLATQSGVIVTSESEEELIDVCDRILVFYQGKIRRVLQRNQPDFQAPQLYRQIQGVGLS